MIRAASRWSRRRPRAACAAAALALAALAAARALAPARAASVAEFPRVRPADLAHLLADVSAHALIPTPWTLEEEAGNYTSWRYAVSFACGTHCAGRAWVRAHDESPHPQLGADEPPHPQHGAARAHTVLLRRAQCRALPLLPLPWPQLCDEIEIEWLVTGSGSGARLAVQARLRCGAPAALLGACPGAAALRRARAAHLRGLRALLAPGAPAAPDAPADSLFA